MSTAVEEFNLDTFLTDLGLSDKDFQTAKTLFTDGERQTKLKSSVLRQADYSRKLNDLGEARKTLEAEYAEKEEALEEEAKRTAGIKNTSERKAAEAELKAQAAALKAEKLQALADEYALDTSGIKVEAPKPEEKKPEDDKFRTEVYEIAGVLGDIPFILAEIADEYRELNPGKRFPMAEFKAAAMKNAKKKVNMYETAEQLYKFTEKREAKKVADIEAAADAKYKAKYEADLIQEMSKQGISYSPRSEQHGSHLFRTGKPDRTNPNRGKEAALKHLREVGQA